MKELEERTSINEMEKIEEERLRGRNRQRLREKKYGESRSMKMQIRRQRTEDRIERREYEEG